MTEISDIIYYLTTGLIFGGLIGTSIFIFTGDTEYGTLHRINTDLKYCPHPDYYYNDHMKDCDQFGITPTHPTLNLTGY